MTELTPAKDWIAMRDNVRRVVKTLEVCWRCQRVSECRKYVLGNMVLVWLCQGCLVELEQPQPGRSKARGRLALQGKTRDSEHS